MSQKFNTFAAKIANKLKELDYKTKRAIVLAAVLMLIGLIVMLSLLPLLNKGRYGQDLLTIEFSAETGLPPIQFSGSYELPNPEKTGYDFGGWYVSEDFSGDPITIVTQNTKLYPNWLPKEYTLTFDTNSDSIIAPLVLTYDSVITRPLDPIKTGYKFDNWYTSLEYDEIFEFGNMPAANTTIFAKWTINDYTITFVSNGGSQIAPMTQPFGSQILSPMSIKNGYSLVGWCKNAQLDSFYIFDTMPSANTTLYAKWQRVDYTISYILNEGINSEQNTRTSYNIEESVDIILHAPTKTGYNFLGWYLEPAYNTAISKIDAGSFGNKDLYAKWQVISYPVSFEVEGGVPINDIYYNYGSSLNLPDPEKTGYTFLDWYLDDERIDVFNISAMPNNPLTVYAKWQINTYTISFETNGGSQVDPIVQLYDTTVQKPADPERSYYDFVSWYEDSQYTTLFVFDKMTKDVTLYAKWDPHSFVISFEYEGGTGEGLLTEKTVYYGLTFGDLPQPSKSFHNFLGWFTQPLSGGIGYTASSSVDITQHTTLYARWAEYYTSGLSFSLNADNESYYVMKGNANTNNPISIPSYYNGKPVTIIGGGAFNYTNVPQIRIPSTIVEIRDYAFNNCTSLMDIDFESLTNLTKIGKDAFKKCTSFTGITLPQSLTTLGLQAFYGCANLTHIEFTSYMELTNYSEMFKGCVKTETLVIPVYHDFQYMLFKLFGTEQDAIPETLTKVEVINGSTGIYSHFFISTPHNTSIKEVVVPVMNFTSGGLTMSFLDALETLTAPLSLGENNSFYTYYEATGETLKTINITEGTTIIPFRAFQQIRVETINIPDSVTVIEDEAFFMMHNLTSLNIPSSVTTIGKSIIAFSELLSITVAPENENFIISEGILFDMQKTRLVASPYLLDEDYIIPASVSLIEGHAFASSKRTNISIEAGSVLETIGNNAFMITLITEMTLPSSLKTIGNNSFAQSLLTSITVPNGVTSVGYNAFSGCAQLTSAIFEEGSALTEIGSGVFQFCEALTEATLPQDLTAIPDSCFYGCEILGDVALPQGIESIGSYAFKNTAMTEFTFSNGGLLKSIGYEAFADCLSLVVVIIPEGVESIAGENGGIVNGCSSLVYAKLPSTSGNSSQGFFRGCSSLVEIDIYSLPLLHFACMFGKGIEDDGNYKEIGYSYYTYYVPNSLKKITYRGQQITAAVSFSQMSMLEEIHFINASGVEGRGKLSGCDSLTSITVPLDNASSSTSVSLLSHYFSFQNEPESSVVPAGLTSVFLTFGQTQIAPEAFKDLINVSTIIIPDSVSIIGNNAFEGMTALVSIVLSEELSQLGAQAFMNCSSLISVNIPKTSSNGTIIGGSSMFLGCHNDLIIYVPDATSEQEYKTLEYWSDYSDIIRSLIL